MGNEVEFWKDVPNYEGLYQVSSFGRVKSFIIHNGTNERILKQTKRKKYLFVNLYKNGNRNPFNVHVLVAMAFHGHVPDGTQRIVVDHKDNDKLNNRADNLQLTTARHNTSKDKKGGTSEYTGVCWIKRNKIWQVQIHFKGRVIFLGHFKSEIDANNCYQKAKKEADEGLDLNILYPRGRHKTSQYKGVHWNTRQKKWKATYRGKYLGFFDTEIEAYEAVQNYIASLILKV